MDCIDFALLLNAFSNIEHCCISCFLRGSLLFLLRIVAWYLHALALLSNIKYAVYGAALKVPISLLKPAL